METIYDPIQTSESLGLRINPETIELSTSCGTIDLHCPNSQDHFEHIHQLIQQSTISLVTVIENHGLEIPLVKWLRERGVDVVVVSLSGAQSSLIDKLDAAGHAYGKAKLILAGVAAILGGIMLTGLGLTKLPDGSPLVAGGFWKGPMVIALGIALILMTLLAGKRES